MSPWPQVTVPCWEKVLNREHATKRGDFRGEEQACGAWTLKGLGVILGFLHPKPWSICSICNTDNPGTLFLAHGSLGA